MGRRNSPPWRTRQADEHVRPGRGDVREGDNPAVASGNRRDLLVAGLSDAALVDASPELEPELRIDVGGVHVTYTASSAAATLGQSDRAFALWLMFSGLGTAPAPEGATMLKNVEARMVVASRTAELPDRTWRVVLCPVSIALLPAVRFGRRRCLPTAGGWRDGPLGPCARAAKLLRSPDRLVCCHELCQLKCPAHQGPVSPSGRDISDARVYAPWERTPSPELENVGHQSP